MLISNKFTFSTSLSTSCHTLCTKVLDVHSSSEMWVEQLFSCVFCLKIEIATWVYKLVSCVNWEKKKKKNKKTTAVLSKWCNHLRSFSKDLNCTTMLHSMLNVFTSPLGNFSDATSEVSSEYSYWPLVELVYWVLKVIFLKILQGSTSFSILNFLFILHTNHKFCSHPFFCSPTSLPHPSIHPLSPLLKR